jgi:hypothetical protein
MIVTDGKEFFSEEKYTLSELIECIAKSLSLLSNVMLFRSAKSRVYNFLSLLD